MQKWVQIIRLIINSQNKLSKEHTQNESSDLCVGDGEGGRQRGTARGGGRKRGMVRGGRERGMVREGGGGGRDGEQGREEGMKERGVKGELEGEGDIAVITTYMHHTTTNYSLVPDPLLTRLYKLQQKRTQKKERSHAINNNSLSGLVKKIM